MAWEYTLNLKAGQWHEAEGDGRAKYSVKHASRAKHCESGVDLDPVHHRRPLRALTA